MIIKVLEFGEATDKRAGDDIADWHMFENKTSVSVKCAITVFLVKQLGIRCNKHQSEHCKIANHEINELAPSRRLPGKENKQASS